MAESRVRHLSVWVLLLTNGGLAVGSMWIFGLER
jgi:hypothetical protein